MLIKKKTTRASKPVPDWKLFKATFPQFIDVIRKNTSHIKISNKKTDLKQTDDCMHPGWEVKLDVNDYNTVHLAGFRFRSFPRCCGAGLAFGFWEFYEEESTPQRMKGLYAMWMIRAAMQLAFEQDDGYLIMIVAPGDNYINHQLHQEALRLKRSYGSVKVNTLGVNHNTGNTLHQLIFPTYICDDYESFDLDLEDA
jgi:hypothetical protein